MDFPFYKDLEILNAEQEETFFILMMKCLNTMF